MLLEIGKSLQQESFNDRTYREARLVEAIKVLSDYTGQIEEEDATGRFHASIAITRQASDRCGGWPLTLRGDFDHQLIARLNAIGLLGDPCQLAAPSYIFRWSSTGDYYGQALMSGS